jgi:hypothetical protein
MKCKKSSKGPRTDILGYILIAASVPLAFFYPTFAIIFLGLGLFSYFTSKNYICQDCMPKKCPLCNNPLSKKNSCTKCNIIICPSCGSHQDSKITPLPCHSTIIAFLGFIGILIILLASLGPMSFIIIPALLFFLSSKCKNCNKRIITDF